MVTSDPMNMLKQLEEKEMNDRHICDVFHAAATFKKWKDWKNADQSLECKWHILKQCFEECHILSHCEVEMDNELSYLKEELEVEMEGILSFAMKKDHHCTRSCQDCKGFSEFLYHRHEGKKI